MRQTVPVSPDALAYLASYLEEAGLPAGDEPVWRTRRGEPRTLSYWAARRILQRAGERLGTNWTLHDLRHTAATRMARSGVDAGRGADHPAARAYQHHRSIHGGAPGRPARSARRTLPTACRPSPVVRELRRRRHCGGVR
ncbi:site-specific integrase [Streptomyces sp.]|uniref:site-specific integrase n=1 Tax=Streptomyces sp. TaxID=1931 RepID=UPI0034572A21